MRQNFITMKFYETYYYANIVHNVLDDPYAYIRSIHEWYEDNEAALLLPAFPRWNRLQDFCAYIIDSLIDEDISQRTVDAIANSNAFEL